MPRVPKSKGCDIEGRRYAEQGKLKAGDYVVTDGDFTCMPKGARRKVMKDEAGELYINCEDGGHYLVGQLQDGFYVGLYPSASRA